MKIRTANIALLVINLIILCVNIYLMNQISDLFIEIKDIIKTDEINNIIKTDEINDIIKPDDVKEETEIPQNILLNKYK